MAWTFLPALRSATATAVGLCALSVCSGCGSDPPVTAPSATASSNSASNAAASVSAPAPSASAAPAPPKEACWKDASCAPLGGEPFTSTKKVDVHIEGGTVFDGKSTQPFSADVVIDDGVVVHIGEVARSVQAKTHVDAKGLVVSPGFIDTHAHGDPTHPNQNFLAMGVTSICVGQDGRGPSDDRVRFWKGSLRNKRMAVNVVPFTGHGTLRNAAKIGLSKEPTDKQIARLARYVGKEMDDGAWGLTTGLEYRPGVFATKKELIEIAKPVAERDGVIMSHMRSEDDADINDALDELLAQGTEGGARVHVSHIKVVHGKGASRADALLAKLDIAREKGVKVTADFYPYNASYTTINIVFPDFALPPNKYKRVKRDKRAELAEFLRNKIAQRGGPEATLFGTNPFRGQTLAQAAAKLKKPFEDILIDDIGPGGAAAAYFVMDDALQSRLLLDRFTMIATDGSSTSRHPRGYGTFAKIIRLYVNERKTLELGEAIRKMSWLPAETVGLQRIKRGRLAKGWAADVLVFDPLKVRDRADYEHPNRVANGMMWVLVNGVATIADGRTNKRRGGRLLLRPKPESSGDK